MKSEQVFSDRIFHTFHVRKIKTRKLTKNAIFSEKNVWKFFELRYLDRLRDEDGPNRGNSHWRQPAAHFGVTELYSIHHRYSPARQRAQPEENPADNQEIPGELELLLFLDRIFDNDLFHTYENMGRMRK